MAAGVTAELEAARLTGSLWAAVCAAGTLHEARHLAGALDAAWLADRAREIMNAFFTRPSEDTGTASCATDVQRGSL